MIKKTHYLTCERCYCPYTQLRNSKNEGGFYSDLYKTNDKIYCNYCIESLEKNDPDWAIGLMTDGDYMGKYYDIHECKRKLIAEQNITDKDFSRFFDWFAERNNYPSNGSLRYLDLYKESIEDEEDEVVRKVLTAFKKKYKKNEIELKYWW